MKTTARQQRSSWGYSLGEMIVVLVITAMVLTAILGVYGRANRAAEAVLTKIETPVLAAEVLQLMARDLDRIMGPDDISIQIKNGAATRETEIDFQGKITCGKFVDKVKPTFLDAMNEHHGRVLGDKYIPYGVDND